MKARSGFRAKAIIFLAKFFLIYGALQAILLMAPLGGLESWIAGIEAGALGLEAEGSTVLAAGQRFEIVPNCTGLMGASVLAAIIFSLKKPGFKGKAALLAAGSAALFLINLLRLYIVLAVAVWAGAKAAETLHIATWFAVAAAILLIWYKLTERVAGKKAFSEML